ncbi:tight adherence protein D [Cricetibacter osteomyelitidis]|uniref:Tight adherence protein D n=1 Tax=Cricetibacter osteomyelitidis TaxID=1521931 RepID=A0A4R2SYA8_9PAST|nr:tetratricopeptide repeat protein [Cricetibacter osteomyelitidis]TCP94660.1 tight adherence protein D [Cricetibacter osteomyelitidis]
MFFKLTKRVLFCSLLISITACSANFKAKSELTPENVAAKEKLYESTGNYSSLISLYRDVLKTKEDSNIRYKLANNYYRQGDSEASLLYLKPLLQQQGNQAINDNVRLLQIKNLIQLKNYNEAITAATSALNNSSSVSKGEIYNLRGIAYAQIGKLDNARNDLNKSRELFINDVTAVNNLAMLSIINSDYKNAVQLLLPQYLNGVKEPRLIHNLVFALVKEGNIDYAKDIIQKERLNTSPDDLINALRKTERTSTAVHK